MAILLCVSTVINTIYVLVSGSSAGAHFNIILMMITLIFISAISWMKKKKK